MAVEGATAHSSTQGYWGAPTSSIDWCEGNHTHSFYVAEFWNTVSNLGFIILGAFAALNAIRNGFPKRWAVVHLSVVVIGVGSAAFHATLQHVAQQADETPMVWSMLVWTYAVWQPELGLSRGAERLWVVGSSAFAVVFAVVHYEYRFVLAFQVLFGVLVVINLYRIFTRWFPRVRGEPGSRMKGLYWQTMLLAFACWMGDQHLCHHASAMPINPQGHAFWHLLMAASSYIGPTLIQFEHARLLGWDPVWEWTAFGLLPYPVPRKTQRK